MASENTAEQAQAIATMWAWWEREGGERFAASIAGKQPATELADEFSALVAAISSDLEWELGPGDDASAHALTISAAGSAHLRALAERVVRAAPAPDGTWCYRPARCRATDLSGMSLRFGDADLTLASVGVFAEADDARLVVDVGIDHPSFASLDERTKRTVAFLALDWTLGEDDVERWIGTVEVGPGTSSTPLDLAGLRTLVDAYAAEHPEPQWRLLRGHDERGRPLVAVAPHPLRWIDNLPFDQHLAVRMAYRPNDEGLPAEGESDRLNALEDELVALLGESAVLVGHESCQGRRLIHLYCDSGDPAKRAEQVALTWAAAQTPAPEIELTLDPTWRQARR